MRKAAKIIAALGVLIVHSMVMPTSSCLPHIQHLRVLAARIPGRLVSRFARTQWSPIAAAIHSILRESKHLPRSQFQHDPEHEPRPLGFFRHAADGRIIFHDLFCTGTHENGHSDCQGKPVWEKNKEEAEQAAEAAAEDEVVYKDETEKRIRYLNIKITGDAEAYKFSIGKDPNVKKRSRP